MKSPKAPILLPVGQMYAIASRIDATRAECVKAAKRLMNECRLDEVRLQEYAWLDDALRQAHAILLAATRRVIIARIRRRTQNSDEY